MKKYLLTLLTSLTSIVALAQSSSTKSEKISFSTHETNTEHRLKASFPTARAERVQAAFTAALGKAKTWSATESIWTGAHYTASVTPTGLKAYLDKEKSTAKEIALFKQLTADLHQALGQPKPPQAPLTAH